MKSSNGFLHHRLQRTRPSRRTQLLAVFNRNGLSAASERVAEHSLAAPGLLAQLLVSKYCDYLPFYRQKQIFWQRHGVRTSLHNLAHFCCRYCVSQVSRPLV